MPPSCVIERRSGERICPYAAVTSRSGCKFSDQFQARRRVDILGLHDEHFASMCELFDQARDDLLFAALGPVRLRHSADEVDARLDQVLDRRQSEVAGPQHHQFERRSSIALELGIAATERAGRSTWCGAGDQVASRSPHLGGVLDRSSSEGMFAAGLRLTVLELELPKLRLVFAELRAARSSR